MKSLAHYEQALADSRKNTPFRDFVREIASWQPIGLHRNQGKISRFPESNRTPPILSPQAFNEARDSLLSYGIEYDFSKTFMENFRLLFLRVPQPSLSNDAAGNSENAEYGDGNGGLKNCYLAFIASLAENVYHSFSVKSQCANVFDSAAVWTACENVYRSAGIVESSNIFYSRYIHNSSDIWFSRNMIGCRECIFCEWLTNQAFHINNVSYPEAEYRRRKTEILARKSEFSGWYTAMPKDSKNLASNDAQWVFMVQCNRVENGYWLANVRDSRNALLSGGQSDKFNFFDTVCCGAGSDMYATIHGANFVEYIYNGISVYNNSSHIYYSMLMVGCSYCLGCIGLQNRSYCIFNKQYTREEWEKKAAEIFETMQREGSFGKFFPASLCPFFYNESLASLIVDTTESEARECWFLWNTETEIGDASVPEGAIDRSSVRDDDYDRFRKGGVLTDSKGRSYRVLPEEIAFLEKHGLPLPDIHWLERIKQAIGMK